MQATKSQIRSSILVESKRNVNKLRVSTRRRKDGYAGMVISESGRVIHVSTFTHTKKEKALELARWRAVHKLTQDAAASYA
tara:strand:+ start:317 stop:559 length:243 start_codon:yes stop_codon:yes gene_type:complete